MKYELQEIEKVARRIWEKNPKLFEANDKSRAEKQYVLDMFPYPSADGLHTGHVESYTATDIISRYLRMKGKNVLHPQGWDAFGLPAENFAIKMKTHPSITTQRAIATFKKQMENLGFSYDWSREIDSSNPEYYKWTQWFFLLLYKNGLAFRGQAKVNWCESCQTVLANEQSEGGICERCKNNVIQKELEQWFFKITDFIENRGKTSGLLDGLDKIDWPEHTKIVQRNWIGKSEGSQFEMKIEENSKRLSVFTTRLDTVFGMTFALIAPEHQLLQELKPQIKNWAEVQKYLEQAKKKSELQRISEVKEKTGVEVSGIKVINPFTKKAIPLLVSDFVLVHYGTGAVMAVPAHDTRDFDFANKFGLDIKPVIKPTFDGMALKIRITDKGEKIVSGGVITYWPESEKPEEGLKRFTEAVLKGRKCYTGDGLLINSGEYSGLTSVEARKKMTQWLEKEKIGRGRINYKLRDWLVSRQRYWGAPIPIIYCDQCGQVAVSEKDLPVLLPDDVDFMPTGESPLVRSKKFHDVKCPKCGKKARRESDTMDTFICSSWYYFRYADPHNKKEFASKEKIKKWLPVDLYVGGAEHTVLHLLYSRFFTKALHYLGYIDFDEPFLKLRHQGIILAEDGRKMSKSFGNVINPDDVAERYGTDALRLFEMFMGPLEDAKSWDTKGIMGPYRFLESTWNYMLRDYVGMFVSEEERKDWINGKRQGNTPSKTASLLNETIKKVTQDIENLKFNTAISQLMILRNAFYEIKERPILTESLEQEINVKCIKKEDFEKFLILLSPFAPHTAEYLWLQLGHQESIFNEKWPEYDQKLVKEKIISLIVQINGKVRDKLEVKADISEKEAVKTALSSEKIKKWIQGKEIKKTIFVPGKLINIVLED